MTQAQPQPEQPRYRGPGRCPATPGQAGACGAGAAVRGGGDRAAGGRAAARDRRPSGPTCPRCCTSSGRVSWRLLALVWFAGLVGYTWVLTGGLPGLTRGQALTLNVSSSAVSNLVPFGGALGVAVSYAMVRSWGFRTSKFALFTLVTGVWNVMAKLALPVVALLALLISGDVSDPRLTGVATTAALTFLVAVTALVAALSSERAAGWVGRSVATLVGRVPRLRGSTRVAGLERQVLALRHRIVALVRGRWHHLTLGIVAFLGAQALLQWMCLWMLGTALTPVQVFAGFAFGRLLTSVVVTPGGVGISETGAAWLLVAMGGEPAIAASGVVLFSLFVYFLEFGVGGVGYLVWVLRRSWRRPVPVEVAD